MSLGMELERGIREAWVRLREGILGDPAELGRRLARRESKSLRRPPRAWCIAIRGSDRRITAAHWVISPEHAMDLDHPLHPYEPIEHEVSIRKHAIRRYCTPVSFSREDAEDVAEMLGVSRGFLWSARRRGQFGETLIPHLGGKRGRPVPLLSPRGQLLDPSARGYARPHAVWGSMWEFLSREFPEGFEQTVVRKPVFGRLGRKAKAQADYIYKDEMQHIGWMWVCPECGKEVRTIYFPMAVRTLFDTGEFDDPMILKGDGNAESGPARAVGFACGRCHDVYHFSSISKSAWNQVVSYLTAGMLYGSEVERPASFVAERKRTRVRVLNREAPKRRKVFTRLRNGWTYLQIARDLGMTRNAVGLHVMVICREEGVANRRELARKLEFVEARAEIRSQRSEVSEAEVIAEPQMNADERRSEGEVGSQ